MHLKAHPSLKAQKSKNLNYEKTPRDEARGKRSSMHTYEIVDHNQGDDKWKEWRRGKIGASDAPIIMGVSKWKTPLQLWEEHIYGKSQETTLSMQKGKDIEPIARAQINFDHAMNYQPVCMQLKARDWMIASLDGWDETGPLPKILEIKYASREDHEVCLDGKVPDHYYPQLQHQMLVAGCKEALYLSMYQGIGVKVIVEKNEDYCQELLKKEEEFYDMLNSFKAPEATERDIVEVNDDTALILARSYRAVQSKLDELTKEKEEIRDLLIKSAGHPRVNIGGLKLRKDFVKGRVDYDAIEILKTIDKEQYRKPGSFQWKVFS